MKFYSPAASIGALLVLLVVSAPATTQNGPAPVPAFGPDSDGPLTLWYRKPAAQWREALPIGNGRLGAMVFGGANATGNNGDTQSDADKAAIADGAHTRPQDEHLQLNEDTIWQGNRKDRLNPRAGAAVPEIRRLLFAGDSASIAKAEKLAEDDMIDIPKQLPSYSTLGDLYLRSLDPAPATDYRRSLNLATGVVRVTYTSRGIRYTREVFSSAPDHVIVLRLTASKPGSISFIATMDRPYDFIVSTRSSNVLALDPGIDHKEAIRFHGEVEALNTGGTVHAEVNSIKVDKADSVTLLIAAATDFKGGPFSGADPKQTTAATLAAASVKPYASLQKDAIRDHAGYFDRVQLKLGSGPDPLASTPTDERLQRAAAGADDAALAALYFQYGRYLLISSSRPGGLPSNLQGLWAAGIDNPWGSKWTININLEMNYWLAEVGNLSELHQPLFDLLDMIRNPATGTGVEVAQKYYNSSGFMAHHNTDIWGDAVPIDGYHWGIWPMGAAWLTLDAWDHYDYTGDRDFLARRAYPLLKADVEFFLDYLTPDADGHLVTGPSLSPENSYKLADGSEHSLTMGPTMDLEILHALFDRFVRASGILGQDPALRARAVTANSRLLPYQIGSFGQLQEWPHDYLEAEPGHRHVSHMFALFPDDQISMRNTPELAKALHVTLERRLANGGGQTGWSRAWVMNMWDRFGEGDKAYESLQVLLRQSTYPNLLDDCTPGPVFQIDGNLGGATGIANMLVHSTDLSGTPAIEFLPALPSAWSQGEFSGLRTRGGGTLSLRWANGRATVATLRTTLAGAQIFYPPKGQRVAAVLDGTHRLGTSGPIQLQAGKTYTILFQ